jgi:fumarylacetoacetate (FAA) hydrolase
MFSPKEAALERGWPGRIEGDRVIQLAAQTLQAFFTGGGGAREHAEYPLAEVDLRAPVLLPPGIRVFQARGADGPRFQFANAASIRSPEETVEIPEGTSRLEHGLALAAMVGADGHIGGFTVANDWTAPDLPGAKSHDFAISIGPVLVTPDEFPGDSGAMVARVNGEERSRAEVAGLPHSWRERIERAALNTRLRPGDLLLAQARQGDGQPLSPGDVVELEIEGIGVLRNRVA